MSILKVLPSPLLLAVLAACSNGNDASVDGGGPAVCTPYTVPAGTDLKNPTVSFENDVMPIFKLSCAFSSCHGAAVGRNQGVFLGQDKARVHQNLINTKAQVSSLSYVVPGDPAQSFLMHKVDGDQCTLKDTCTGGKCGDSMPQGGGLMSVANRDAIRRWIAQGAPNN